MVDMTVEEVQLELSRKAVKHLRIMVAPPDGRVRVSAPKHWPESAVRAAVTARLPWIRRHVAYCLAQPRRYLPQYTSGESHWVWGVEHRLQRVTATGQSRVDVTADGLLRVSTRPEANAHQCERLVNEWYRRQLQGAVAEQLDPWQRALGVSVSAWGIKRMRTRWGSCNISARRIWLSLALAKLPPECCEYVLVHELAHLLERHHNARFWAIVERHLPEWRAARAQLALMDELI